MGTDRDILDVISKLRARRREIEESIHEPLAQIDRDLEAATRTLELLKEFQGTSVPEIEPVEAIKASELVGLTQPEALLKIADRTDGILYIPKVRRLFIESGLSKSKWVSQGIRSRIHRLGCFEYIAPGTFRRISNGDLNSSIESPDSIGMDGSPSQIQENVNREPLGFDKLSSVNSSS